MDREPTVRSRDGKSSRRLFRPTPAAALVGRLVDGATRSLGFVDSRLVTDWPTIVGAALAAETMPLKLDRRTRALTLKVRPTAALLVQHEEPQILERINLFFGREVAMRLRLVQGAILRPPKPPEPRRLTAGEAASIDRAVACVPEAELRSALRGLGVAVARRRPAPPVDGTS